MNLLLDTHIWIWNDLQPEKISSYVAQQLARSHIELWLSPVSVWELLLLVEKKRLRLAQQFHVWVSDSVRDLDLREAALTWNVVHELPFTILPHWDPADRFIVAAARAYDTILITSDAKLLQLQNLKLMANE